jgi:hypothetical protein
VQSNFRYAKIGNVPLELAYAHIFWATDMDSVASCILQNTQPLPSPKGETKAEYKYKFCRQSWCLAVLPWFPL